MKLAKNKENLNKITTLLTQKTKNSHSFKKDYFLSRYQHSDGYGISHNNKLSSYLMLNHFRGRIFTKRIRMAGIGYPVACKDNKQLTSLIKEVIYNLRGKDILTLNISSVFEDLVSDFDFETTTEEKIYTFKKKALAPVEGNFQGKVKDGKWSDLLVQNGAAQLYEVPLHSSDERLTMNRDFWWWNRIDKNCPDRKLAVYFGPVGLPEAYMFYWQKQDDFYVQEMYGNKGEGIQGLLHYLARQGNEQTVYHLVMPVESHLEYLLSQENLVKIRIKPLILSRILNFPKVLGCMKTIENGSFNIGLENDQLCPANNGTWQISTDQKKLVVKKTKEKADFTGSIAAWTQVLLGSLTLDDALRFGNIKKTGRKMLHFEKGRISFFDEI